MSVPVKVWNIKDPMLPSDWKSRSDFAYIGRPSAWGNPFPVQRYGRAEAIRQYAVFLTKRQDIVQKIQAELRGKHLVCFCKPQACHGDTLLEIANASL